MMKTCTGLSPGGHFEGVIGAGAGGSAGAGGGGGGGFGAVQALPDQAHLLAGHVALLVKVPQADGGGGGGGGFGAGPGLTLGGIHAA